MTRSSTMAYAVKPDTSFRFKGGMTGFLMVLATAAPALAQSPTSCAPGQGIKAVDMSSPVNASLLSRLKGAGINSVVRYYDQVDETIRGKTLTTAEVGMIGRAGMSVAVVFQHHNDKVETFLDPLRGTQDAMRALDLARTLGQPKGSTIYFGVDGVESQFAALPEMQSKRGADKYGLSYVKSYFKQVARLLKPAGYEVGIYGSGMMCGRIKDGGLADRCWLSNAKGWPEYDLADKGHIWSMKQSLTIPAKDCFGTAVDPNVVAEEDFGQWSPRP